MSKLDKGTLFIWSILLFIIGVVFVLLGYKVWDVVLGVAILYLAGIVGIGGVYK